MIPPIVTVDNPYLNNPDAREIRSEPNFLHEGKTYTKLTYEVTKRPVRTDITVMARLFNIIYVVALSILTCFIALAFEQVRKCWTDALNGYSITPGGVENVPVLVPVNHPSGGRSSVSSISLGLGTGSVSSSKGSTSTESSESDAIDQPLSGLKPEKAKIRDCFKNVDSSVLKPQKCSTREDFLNNINSHAYSPLVISKSPFVSHEMATHLMENKKGSALAVKYVKGDAITNMEGALHTFVTPIAQIEMTGDYAWKEHHSAAAYPGFSRTVILSAAIHPDFERAAPSEVVMPLIECKDKEIIGKSCADATPLAQEYDPKSAEFAANLPGYEDRLLKHMIYHLRRDHTMPAKSSGKVFTCLLEASNVLPYLETRILDEDIVDVAKQLAPWYGEINGHVISLEALFMVYYHQLRNEFSVLEQTLPQGYVYTIDPPSIFAAQFGQENVPILNRMQILAFKQLQNESTFENLKMIGFNDYADKGAINLYRKVFPNKDVVPKAALFQGKDGRYFGQEGAALVEHNNSDAFGNNIKSEGPTSKDGIIGVYSNAALELLDRPDLMNVVV